ncbi:hypothetical protein [Peribacillus frigoritolerans]|uniref:hypothetical protein n=1 Tax=Peribacillus frigoritolerans TaxID=450367 RepID=UPI0032B4E70E
MAILTKEQFEVIENRKELVSCLPHFNPEHAFQLFMMGAKRLAVCKELDEKDFAAVWFSPEKVEIQNKSQELVI